MVLMLLMVVMMLMVVMVVMFVIYSAEVCYVNPGGPLPPTHPPHPSQSRHQQSHPRSTMLYFVPDKMLSIGVLVNSYPELCVLSRYTVHEEGHGDRRWFGRRQNETRMSSAVGSLQRSQVPRPTWSGNMTSFNVNCIQNQDEDALQEGFDKCQTFDKCTIRWIAWEAKEKG